MKKTVVVAAHASELDKDDLSYGVVVKLRQEDIEVFREFAGKAEVAMRTTTTYPLVVEIKAHSEVAVLTDDFEKSLGLSEKKDINHKFIRDRKSLDFVWPSISEMMIFPPETSDWPEEVFIVFTVAFEQKKLITVMIPWEEIDRKAKAF